MKLLLQYLRRYRKWVFVALLLATIDQVFISFNPYILGNMLIDPFAYKARYYREHGMFREFLQGIGHGLLLMVIVSTVAWVSKGFQHYVVNVVVRKLCTDLYNDVQSHILRLPYQAFEDERSGEILSVLQRAQSDCDKFITKFVNVLFVSTIAMCFVIIVAFQLSPYLPLVYIGSAAALSAILHFLSRKVAVIQKEILDETNALAGSTTESLRNIELVKSLGLIQQEIHRFFAANSRILGNEIRKMKKIRSLSFIYGAFVQTLNQCIVFLLLIFLFYDKLTVGQLLMMQIYFFFILGTLEEFGAVILSYREAEASMNNLGRLMSRPAERPPGRPEKIGVITHLRFDSVHFQHVTAMRPALESISFDVKMGETVAIAGPSGAGKTTLIKLLTGLYQPTGGNIYCNESCLTRINLDELRHQTGLVTQDTQLFSGTIKENLLFVNPQATDRMIEHVLESASCQNLLARAAKGIDTRIGEGGLKLSGGERQRLAIARSLLRESSLLIFDEATSSLDSLTERQIAGTIRQITSQGKYITLMIAHRLSTIMFADRIHVLEKGRIIETGDHASLLEEKGLYYAMWRQQIGEWKDEVNMISYEQ
ncbi:MAG: ABC transporter ATP-binding protein [Chitinophagaceae bacterium]|nr:ABC transporter ATP-binding protein [Chitinophagaceae bacterium]